MKRNCFIIVGVLILIFGISGCKKNSVVEETLPVLSLELEFGTVSDNDGNTYKTVKIGDQWWMAENLKVKQDPNGNPIESFCYNNDESIADVYGRLYSWDVIMNGSKNEGAQGIAPDGWHIPTIGEWDQLMNTLGGYGVAGGYMKVTGIESWNSPNTDATNLSEFSALAGGEIDRGTHRLFGEVAVFWSSTESAIDRALYVHVHYNNKRATQESFFKTVMKYSVRCIKD